jgi:hypothetical protein
MLRANVGVSRKVTTNYQSAGYQVNLDGEIPFTQDDAEGVLEKIRELFDLAHEAVRQEIERDQGDASVARRDEPAQAPAPPKTAPPKPRFNGRLKNHSPQLESPSTSPSAGNGNGSPPNGHQNGTPEPATNKQIQFILTMGKRLNLNTAQIADEIAKITGREVGIYDLSKKEAGKILDFWTTQVPA